MQWEEVSVTPVLRGGKTVIPESAITSVKKNTVALKGKSWYLIYYDKYAHLLIRTFGHTE